MSRAAADRATPAIPKVVVPLVAVAALIWHLLSIGVGVGGPDNPAGGHVATAVYSLETGLAGGQPYADGVLQRAARADGVVGRVAPPFEPPSEWLTMAWAMPLHIQDAWVAWIVLHELLFLLGLGLLVYSWRSLGPAPGLALVGAAAVMTGVSAALDEAFPVLLMLTLLIGALTQRDRPIASGVLLGLAACLSLRAWIVAPLWLARRQFAGFGIALAVFVGINALTIPLVGTGPHIVFWRDVVPALLVGNFAGLGLRIDAFGNAAPAHIWATMLPNTGQVLSSTALAITWLLGVVTVGGLAASHRHRSEDPWVFAARTALWLGLVALLPVFGLERMTPWALPAIALAVAGIWHGRIGTAWAIPVGIAIAVLCYPLTPLRQLWQLVLQPDLPWAAPLLREAKLGSWLVVLAATAILSRSRPPE